MRITTQGTSHGNHTYNRFNSSTLVEVDDVSYLIDAGAPANGLRIGSAVLGKKCVISQIHISEGSSRTITGKSEKSWLRSPVNTTCFSELFRIKEKTDRFIRTLNVIVADSLHGNFIVFKYWTFFD